MDTLAKAVILLNGDEVRYGWLLLACGAVPRHLPVPPNPHVITIRDHNSVVNLAALLKSDTAKRLRVVLIGGGGIAMELALHPVLQNCDVIWVSPSPSPTLPISCNREPSFPFSFEYTHCLSIVLPDCEG